MCHFSPIIVYKFMPYLKFIRSFLVLSSSFFKLCLLHLYLNPLGIDFHKLCEVGIELIHNCLC